MMENSEETTLKEVMERQTPLDGFVALTTKIEDIVRIACKDGRKVEEFFIDEQTFDSVQKELFAFAHLKLPEREKDIPTWFAVVMTDGEIKVSRSSKSDSPFVIAKYKVEHGGNPDGKQVAE